MKKRPTVRGTYREKTETELEENEEFAPKDRRSSQKLETSRRATQADLMNSARARRFAGHRTARGGNDGIAVVISGVDSATMILERREHVVSAEPDGSHLFVLVFI